MSKTTTQQEGWREVKLGDVADVRDGTHDSPKQQTTGKYLITSRHIKNGKIDFTKAYKISLEDFEFVNKRSKVDEYDILFSMIGTIGETVLVDFKPDFAIKNVGLFKTKDKDLSTWIFYYLKSSNAQNEIYAKLKGSTQQYITLGDLRSFPILLPPPPEQKAIAEVLSSLDDKIDLLHHQNKTLEDMAQALFRKWFMDNPERENWKKKKIGEVLETKLGGTPSTSKFEYWDGDVPWINSGEINKFRIFEPTKYITKLGLEKSATKLLPKGSTVIAITGATLGQVSLLEIDTCANQSVIGIIPNNNFTSEFVYLWIKEIIKELIANQTGGAQQHINKNDVYDSLIIIPPKEFLVEKYSVFKDIFNKISRNVSQIRTLENLRDALLPKLMSGDLGVKSY